MLRCLPIEIKLEIRLIVVYANRDRACEYVAFLIFIQFMIWF